MLRVFLGVILVILLRRIERAGGQDLRRDLAVKTLEDLLARRVGCAPLLRAPHEHGRMVIGTGVTRLAVRLERVDVVPERSQQRLVADLCRVVDHPDRFEMARVPLNDLRV